MLHMWRTLGDNYVPALRMPLQILLMILVSWWRCFFFVFYHALFCWWPYFLQCSVNCCWCFCQSVAYHWVAIEHALVCWFRWCFSVLLILLVCQSLGLGVWQPCRRSQAWKKRSVDASFASLPRSKSCKRWFHYSKPPDSKKEPKTHCFTRSKKMPNATSTLSSTKHSKPKTRSKRRLFCGKPPYTATNDEPKNVASKTCRAGNAKPSPKHRFRINPRAKKPAPHMAQTEVRRCLTSLSKEKTKKAARHSIIAWPQQSSNISPSARSPSQGVGGSLIVISASPGSLMVYALWGTFWALPAFFSKFYCKFRFGGTCRILCGMIHCFILFYDRMVVFDCVDFDWWCGGGGGTCWWTRLHAEHIRTQWYSRLQLLL